jgi:hypothetical protein
MSMSVVRVTVDVPVRVRVIVHVSCRVRCLLSDVCCPFFVVTNKYIKYIRIYMENGKYMFYISGNGLYIYT